MIRKYQHLPILSPYSNIQSTTNSNNIIKNLTIVAFLAHPQFGVNEVHSKITGKRTNLGDEN